MWSGISIVLSLVIFFTILQFVLPTISAAAVAVSAFVVITVSAAVIAVVATFADNALSITAILACLATTVAAGFAAIAAASFTADLNTATAVAVGFSFGALIMAIVVGLIAREILKKPGTTTTKVAAVLSAEFLIIFGAMMTKVIPLIM